MSGGETGRRFLSSYCMDMDEQASPRHQAVLRLQDAIDARARRPLQQALVEMVDAGIDLNAFILQDTSRTWFNLASYFLSRGTNLGLTQLDVLLERSEIDLNLHRSTIFDGYARKNDRTPPRLVPFVHTVMVAWGGYLGVDPDNPSRADRQLDVTRSRSALDLFDRLAGMDLDWNKLDSEGGGVAHAMFRHANGDACCAVLPWLIERGVSLSVINDAGQTPVDYARQRLTGRGAKMKGLDRISYNRAISLYEQAVFEAKTQAPDPSVLKSRGLRL